MSLVEVLAWISVLFFPLAVLGSALLLIWKAWKKDESIRIEWDRVGKFLVYMAVVSILRICLADLINNFMPGYVQAKAAEISRHVGFMLLPLVFWEDVFFGMSIAAAWKRWGKTKPKIAITFTILISTFFAQGHLYQGMFGLITIIYPFFISYHYGKKYGFGTVMVCHFLYDAITLMTVKLAALLIGTSLLF